MASGQQWSQPQPITYYQQPVQYIQRPQQVLYVQPQYRQPQPQQHGQQIQSNPMVVVVQVPQNVPIQTIQPEPTEQAIFPKTKMEPVPTRNSNKLNFKLKIKTVRGNYFCAFCQCCFCCCCDWCPHAFLYGRSLLVLAALIFANFSMIFTGYPFAWPLFFAWLCCGSIIYGYTIWCIMFSCSSHPFLLSFVCVVIDAVSQIVRSIAFDQPLMLLFYLLYIPALFDMTTLYWWAEYFSNGGVFDRGMETTYHGDRSKQMEVDGKIGINPTKQLETPPLPDCIVYGRYKCLSKFISCELGVYSVICPVWIVGWIIFFIYLLVD
eukprot:348205_1